MLLPLCCLVATTGFLAPSLRSLAHPPLTTHARHTSRVSTLVAKLPWQKKESEDDGGEDAGDTALPGAPPGPPTALAADIFAGMKAPISVDTPEGQEALARLQETAGEGGGGAPPGPPTALAADVFAGMKAPISVDTPEGQEALARLQGEEPAGGSSDEQTPSSGLTGEKVRELLDGGLGEAQVRAILAAEGVSPEEIETVFKAALALPAAAPPPAPPPPPPPPPPPVPPPPAPVASPAASIIDADEKLYPMPEVPKGDKQIFLPFVPFGVAPLALGLTSVAVAFVLGLLIYLLSLTSGAV